MAATLSRHHGHYARPSKTQPISMPTKTSTTYNLPTSRVAMPPPELSDTSTIYSSRRSAGTFSDISDDYESSRYPSGIDVMDELSDRMNSVFDPMKMDKSIARQAQTSGELNAKQRELAELQAQMQRRVRKTRVRIDETLENAAEASRDLKYSKEKIAAMKAQARKEDPDAYEAARRSRHSRR